MPVKAQTNLVRRGAKYQFRVRIPKDLLQAYARLREIRRSLNTSDQQQAIKLAREERAALDREFDAKRAGVAHSVLTDDQIKALAERWITERLHEDEEQRIGRTRGHIEHAREHNQLHLIVARRDVALGNIVEGVDYEAARAYVREAGMVPPTEEGNFRKFVYALVKAEARAAELIVGRDSGRVIDTPSIPQQARSERVTLDELMEYWKSQSNPRPKTILEAQSAVRRFKEVNGDLVVHEITKRHALALRDKLVEKGAAPATVRKQRLLRRLRSTTSRGTL
jgi:hypothetical protein